MGNEPTYVDGGDEPAKKDIYYHYGFDIGGSEGLVDVVAATDGIVVSFTLRLSELASALFGLAALAYLHFRSQERASEFGIADSAKETSESVPKL